MKDEGCEPLSDIDVIARAYALSEQSITSFTNGVASGVKHPSPFPLPECYFRVIDMYCVKAKTIKKGLFCESLLEFDKCPRQFTIYPDCDNRNRRLCEHPGRVVRNRYGAFNTCIQHLRNGICPLSLSLSLGVVE